MEIVFGVAVNLASTTIVEGVKYVKDAFEWEYPKPQTEVLLHPVPDSGYTNMLITAMDEQTED